MVRQAHHPEPCRGIAQSYELFALGYSLGMMKQVGIFTATRWELNAVRRAVLVEEETRVGGARCVIGRRGNCRLLVIQTGVGTAKADAVCRKVFRSHTLDLAVSSGFACALTVSHIGDLLIGTDVMMHRGPANSPDASHVIPCAEQLSAAAVRAAQETGVAARAGRFVTVPHVVWRAQEKREIAAGTGAVGLDMESAAVGAAALERNIPFAIVRAVSDLLDEDLPFDFNLWLSPTGWARGTLTCLARPSSLIALNRFRAQTALASERMTRFWGRFLDDLE